MAHQISERDSALLLDMLLAARDALDFIRDLNQTDFVDSRLHQSAVIRSLEIIGEAAGKVSATARDAHPEIAWRDMAGMRHRLIHGDADVRIDLVWEVASKKLQPLVADLEPLILSENDQGDT